MRHLAAIAALLIAMFGGGTGASPARCGMPLVDLLPRYLPGKTAGQAAAPGALPSCFHVVRLTGAEAVLITSDVGEGAVAWKQGRPWTLRPAELQGLRPQSGSIYFLSGQPELHLLAAEAGSGEWSGFSRLLHGRTGPDGRIRFHPLNRGQGEILTRTPERWIVTGISRQEAPARLTSDRGFLLRARPPKQPPGRQ